MASTKGKAPTAPKAGRSGKFMAKRDSQSGQFTAHFAMSAPMPGAGFLGKARLKKSGGSLVMTVPAAARNMLGLTEGQEMAVSVHGGQVIAEPMKEVSRPMRARQPKYTIEELVEGYDASIPLTDEERAWQDAAPVGREVW